jgi:hypothetical protein
MRLRRGFLFLFPNWKTMTVRKLTEDPTYLAAEQKLTELKAQRGEIEQQLAGMATGRVEHVPSIDRAAQALLNGTPADAANDQQRDELSEKLRVVERAIEMQRKTVDGERARVSREVCQAALPAHKQNVAKVGRALAALAEAAAKEETLREELLAAGVSLGATIRPMPVVSRTVGAAAELSELAEAYAKEAREFGLA